MESLKFGLNSNLIALFCSHAVGFWLSKTKSHLKTIMKSLRWEFL